MHTLVSQDCNFVDFRVYNVGPTVCRSTTFYVKSNERGRGVDSRYTELTTLYTVFIHTIFKFLSTTLTGVIRVGGSQNCDISKL